MFYSPLLVIIVIAAKPICLLEFNVDLYVLKFSFSLFFQATKHFEKQNRETAKPRHLDKEEHPIGHQSRPVASVEIHKA